MEEWVKTRRGWILLGVSYILVAGLAFLVARWPSSGSVEILQPPATQTPETAATPAAIRVYVSGAVHSPGVYTLAPDSIAEDALQLAGGPTEDADLTLVNLAATLHDGQQLHVPAFGQEPVPTVPLTALPLLVNVNVADAAELQALPGIGPVTADSIIAYREEHGPFRTVDALLLVPGIGPATLEKIRGFVAVQ
jgi:competence protein ComEA